MLTRGRFAEPLHLLGHGTMLHSFHKVGNTDSGLCPCRPSLPPKKAAAAAAAAAAEAAQAAEAAAAGFGGVGSLDLPGGFARHDKRGEDVRALLQPDAELVRVLILQPIKP